MNEVVKGFYKDNTRQHQAYYEEVQRILLSQIECGHKEIGVEVKHKKVEPHESQKRGVE